MATSPFSTVPSAQDFFHTAPTELNGHIDSNSDIPSGYVAEFWTKSTDTNGQRHVMSGNYNGSTSINLDGKSKLLLQLIDSIVKDASGAESQMVKYGSYKLIPGVSVLIHKIACQISNDCQKKSSAHERVKSLLGLLSNCSSDTKIVLVLAAFAISYGDFIVIMNQYTNKSDKFINSLVHLKQLTGTFMSESTLKSQITLIKGIINELLLIVNIIIELKDFRSWDKIMLELQISDVIYWMIKTIIHCGSSISDLSNGYPSSLNEQEELSISTNKIKKYYMLLTTHIDNYRTIEEEIRVTEAYQQILSLLRFPPATNIEVLEHFIISSVTDINILYNHKTKASTTLQIFQDKKVLILYSSFATETFQEELLLLERFYNNTHPKFGYEIVWVPIKDQNTTIIDEKSYNEIISKMPYYVLSYESVLKVNHGLIHMLRKDWGFTGMPILVVLNESGQLVQQNALLMLHLYGDEAFPFTHDHESQLLTKIPKGMQFLLTEIDARISRWIVEKNQFVCLYGGEDLKWCTSMVELLGTILKTTNIEVMTAYVERNTHHKDKVEETLKAFTEAKLGYNLKYSSSAALWERIQKYMLHFSTHESSDVSQEFLSWASALLTFDKSKDSWVAIGDANHIVVFRGSIFVSGLDIIRSNLVQWKSQVTTVNFLQLLREMLKDLRKKEERHCHELEIMGKPGLLQGGMCCPTCDQPMELVTLYRCCK